MSRGHILVNILTTVRDNPGARPRELYKLLEKYRIGPFWLKTCKRNGYIVDAGAVERKRVWAEYKSQHPEPIPVFTRTEEEEAADIKKFEAWYSAGPARIHPAIRITERGLARIDGPLPVHPRRRYEFEFFENELKQVDAVLNALNNDQPVGGQCYRYAKDLHEEQVEDSDSPLYVVKMKLHAKAFEAIRVLEHQLHGGGFSLE